MQALRTALRDIFDVLIDAGRLLLRHWPVLAALALLGVTVRGAAHWGAVVISDRSPWLAHVVLLIAPLGYLVPVIAMLHYCGRDLPAVRSLRERAPEDATSGQRRTLLHVTVSVLVPFLAVYVANNLLREDFQAFQNAAVADEFNRSLTEDVDFSRAGIYPLEVVLMIVAVATGLRFLLGKAEGRWKWIGLAAIGALVEVYYTSEVAALINWQKSRAESWLLDRRAVDWAHDRYTGTLEHLGPLAHPADTLSAWLFGLLGSFDAVVVVPLAWLTVGAVVLGHRLAPEPPPRHPLLERWRVVPEPLRRGAGSLTADIRSRFSALINGLRMMARAGLVPMLLFCLAYLVALRIPYLFALGMRRLMGPTETTTWLAFSPIEGAVGLALSMVMISVLLAAAIDRMIQPALAEPVSPAPATAGTAASPTTSAPA